MALICSAIGKANLLLCHFELFFPHCAFVPLFCFGGILLFVVSGCLHVVVYTLFCSVFCNDVGGFLCVCVCVCVSLRSIFHLFPICAGLALERAVSLLRWHSELLVWTLWLPASFGWSICYKWYKVKGRDREREREWRFHKWKRGEGGHFVSGDAI